MWRSIIVVGVIQSMLLLSAEAQVSRQFSVEDKEEVKKVDFSFKVSGGRYMLQAGKSGDNLINIYTNENLDSYSHKYNKQIIDNICNVALAFEGSGEETLSSSISYKMFGDETEAPDKVWKVFLAPDKPQRLSLNYGFGLANIDLSGLSIENLKVYSGNADVRIDYSNNAGNKVKMDTFSVSVDLGSVFVSKLNLCKSEYVHADVGFGNMSLDFSDKPVVSSNINGSVGAGNLMITLPHKDVPVKVKVTESWLCKIKLPNDFEKVANNTYVNTPYKEGRENVLNFDLDVSMGSIIFKTTE